VKEAKKLNLEEQTEAKLVATGVKQVAENAEAVAEAETKESASDQVVMPNLFIEPERRIRVNIEVLFDPTDGKVLMVAAVPEGRTKNELKYLKRATEWLEFSHPNYDDMVGYRENSMSYDKNTQQFLTDPVKLRLCFIRYHLVGWSLRDKDGEEIEVGRDGVSLTPDTLAKVGSIMPAIIDIALTEFEKETLLGT
jgi:hypothetical protein